MPKSKTPADVKKALLHWGDVTQANAAHLV